MIGSRRVFLLGGVSTIAVGAIAGVFSAPQGRAMVPPGDGGQRFPVRHTDDEWRRLLGPARFDVMRRAGTEFPFSSRLDHETRPGRYECAGCRTPLYDASTKFDSGTGWPSFFRPLPHAVDRSADGSLGMERTEIHCATCGSHLGHVFADGPPPTGLRYCMNGIALLFAPTQA